MKSIMTLNTLTIAGADNIAQVVKGKMPYATSHDNSQPGFYFFVNKKTQLVDARFFAGRQRSKQGLNGIIGNINRIDCTYVALMLRRGTYDVYFIHADKMKPLTTGHGKGQIAMAFTRSYQSPYQTLTEVNQILGDNFKFTLQN